MGRLGNQMFQIASTIGIARDNGTDYVFPAWEYSYYMNKSLPVGALNNTSDIHESGFHYTPILLNEGNKNLVGYLQSERYFIKYKEEVMQYFKLKDEHRDYIRNKYGPLLAHSNTCSVHVRRTDYLKLQQHHPVLSLDYYKEAMNKFPDALFLIFSDDIAWCKDNLKFDNTQFIEGENPIVDMYLMSMCKNNIIANSSFSWWSAWMNGTPDKKVIAPKAWFGPAYRDMSTNDLLPETWIKI